MLLFEGIGREKVASRSGERRLAGVRSPRGPRADARDAMLDLINPMALDVSNALAASSGMAPAEQGGALRALLLRWREAFAVLAVNLPAHWSSRVNIITKTRFEGQIATALGIDRARIIDGEQMALAIQLASMDAAGLITNVPEQYFSEVGQAVLRNLRGEEHPEGRTFTRQIQHLLGSTRERAELIARDQTAKMTSAFNQVRFEENGIEEYIWRTVGGLRVVGNPSGLYPEGNAQHMNHYERNGKKFRLDSPPPDGHPGQPIQCRCWMEPVVGWSKLRILA